MLSSFKQLLLKTKPKFSKIMANVTDDELNLVVWEALAKATKQASKNSGKDSNVVLKDFANQTTSADQHANTGSTNSILGDTNPLIHDALSHHLSQYHAERQAGNNEPADKHLSQAMKYMALGHKASRGDEGSFFAPSAKPWEQTYAPGQAVNFARNIYSAKDSGGGGSKFPDHNYLENTPNAKHSAIFKEHGDQSYPWHDVKVGNKHLDLHREVEPNGKYEAHPLDSHPIMSKLGKMTADPSEIENPNHRHAPMFYAGVDHMPEDAVDNYHRQSIDWANNNLDTLKDVHDKHANASYGSERPDRLHNVDVHKSNAARNLIARGAEDTEDTEAAGQPTGSSEQATEGKTGNEAEALKTIKMLNDIPETLRSAIGGKIIKHLDDNFSDTDAYKSWKDKEGGNE